MYPQVKSSRRKKNQLLKSFRSRFESRRWFRGRGRRGRIRWKEERERRKRFEEGNDASRVCPKIADGKVGGKEDDEEEEKEEEVDDEEENNE